MTMEQNRLLRVAVIGDHYITRSALAGFAAQWPKGEVVLQAENGTVYRTRLKEHGPVDFVIIDLGLPLGDGFGTIAWIHEHQPGTLVLAISYDPQDAIVHHALLAGAHAILGRDCHQQMVLEALESLRTTGRFVNELLLRQLTFTPDPNSPWLLKQKMVKALPPRVLEFGMHYVGEDSPSREAVAERMGISEHTAEEYRKDLFDLTGARNRLALLYCFIRFGLKSI